MNRKRKMDERGRTKVVCFDERERYSEERCSALEETIAVEVRNQKNAMQSADARHTRRTTKSTERERSKANATI